jgi:lipoprotein-anchoring transpeptidase ErfK/SrfK
LFGIAQRYGVSVADLQAVNGLADFSPIIAGQALVLPGAAPAILTQPALPAPPAWNTPGYAQPYPAQPTWAANPAPAVYNAPNAPYPQPVNPNAGPERWIDVDLTHQTLTAYEGQTPVYTSRVSTGMAQYPTVVGTFEIYVKYEAADMSGGEGVDAYYLPAVPYVMYFYGNYGLHGTYWHNNFGTPMSHGCVNLPTPDAQWLYNWASIGTKVMTHY